MEVLVDPEELEITTLLDVAGDMTGKRVLEIGCGSGRLTWKYADKAAFVMGIDPNDERIKKARESLPEHLRGRVEFQVSELEAFTSTEKFDLAILSWAL